VSEPEERSGGWSNDWHRISVGGLLVVATSAWIVKRFVTNRRTKKSPNLKNAQRPMQMNSRENLVDKKFEERDASLERGHSRRMSQLRSNSPAPSYVLSPAVAVVNWSNSKSIPSASSSITELPRSSDGSDILLPAMAKNPSLLRHNPSDVQLNSNIAMATSLGGSYLPPEPPPRSALHLTNSPATSNLVSPLEVHFSRPTTHQRVSSRPPSYSAQVLPEQAKIALLVPTPSRSVSGATNTEAASIVNSNATTVPEHPPQESLTFNFNFNFFGPEVSTRPPRRLTRPTSSATNDDDRSIHGRSAKDFNDASISNPNPAPALFPNPQV